VASSWRLELPRAINDLDYGALTDVRVTFYYKARFDPRLRDRVLAQLAALPSATARQRGIPLRWLYPDAFFLFQDTGTLSFNLGQADFRHNETRPTLTGIGLLVQTDGSVSPTGFHIGLSTPGHASIEATPDAQGRIDSSAASPWAPLGAGTALGDYTLTMRPEDNPTLVHDGRFDLTPIVNLALIVNYSFTPRA
jgi:hypothetical protein